MTIIAQLTIDDRLDIARNSNGTYSFLKHELIEFSAKGAWALFRVILQCKVIESCNVPWLQQLICPQSHVLFRYLPPKSKQVS